MTHSVRLRRVRGALAFSIGLAAVLSPILGASSRAAPSPQPERPYNILLIVSDDQALRSMAPMPKTRTWFRNEGVKLTNAFATTPLCCPSRSTILTGRYAHNHNVRANTQALNLDTSTTIQHILEQAGYRTGVFGKFLNSWDVATAPPDFDEWAVIPRSSQAYRDGAWNVNGTLQQVEEYGTSFVADAAVGFIERASTKDAPWFAYVSPPAPHSPFTPEPKYRGAPVPEWAGDPSNQESSPFVDPFMKTDKPSYVSQANTDLAKGQRLRARQFRTLMSLDDLVGRLRNTLDRTAEDTDTLVVYISDNGYLWGQHGLTTKGVPYQESVRVPAFIRWPGETMAGNRDDRLVANTDIVPTILDLIGLPTSLQLDGRSLLDPNWTRSHLLLEAWGWRGAPSWAALASTSRVYVEYYGDDETTVSFREYYDLQADPYELNNLLGDLNPLNDPADADELAEELGLARSCSGSNCP